MDWQTECKERIVSEDYMDFIITENRMGNFKDLPEEDLCRQNIGIIYESIHLPRITQDTFQAGRYDYSMIPSCYTLIDTQAMGQVGISQIQGIPSLSLYGEGVMIGFIDTGIAYEDAVFRNTDGSTRIERIWDQTIQTGTPPEGFLYGTEYTRDMINQALSNEHPLEVVPSIDAIGHGTSIASLAAGGVNTENQFTGAAPRASIAMVKLKPIKKLLRDYYLVNPNTPCYQEIDIMTGLKYLHELANRLGLPLVVCIALGTNLGSHTGSSPLCGLMETYANFSNRVIVTGGGNEANQKHHYMEQFTSKSESKRVEIVVQEGVKGFILELWTSIPNVMAVSIHSPSGEVIPVTSVRKRSNLKHDFVFEQTSVNIDYRLIVEKTGSELIFMRFEDTTPGIWTVTVYPIDIADGVFHMWLPMKEFLTGTAYFINSNPDTTLTEPSNTYSPITVAYYNGSNNAISVDSGRGYTRNNVVKPDFAAPGVDVITAMPGNRFAPHTGSSVSAAITTGAAAILLQWAYYYDKDPDVDSLEVKNYLLLGAQQDSAFTYPNKTFGYGRLDLYNTFLKLSGY